MTTVCRLTVFSVFMFVPTLGLMGQAAGTSNEKQTESWEKVCKA